MNLSDYFEAFSFPVVVMMSVLNTIGFLDGATDMVALGGGSGGYLYDHVPVRLLSAIQLFVGQVVTQYNHPPSRGFLEDCASDRFAWKLRKTKSTQTKRLKTNGLDLFFFPHKDLFDAVEYGVLYILDHPFFVVKDRVPRSGDHKYLYYQRMIAEENIVIPQIHFKRLPTLKVYDRRASSQRVVQDISTGFRYVL